jgi:hypothetical protein
MAAAIVLLSGRVSETGPFLAVSLRAGSQHSATDTGPVARDSGRNPSTTIPELSPRKSVPVGAIPFLQLRNVLIVRDFVLLLPRL